MISMNMKRNIHKDHRGRSNPLRPKNGSGDLTLSPTKALENSTVFFQIGKIEKCHIIRDLRIKNTQTTERLRDKDEGGT